MNYKSTKTVVKTVIKQTKFNIGDIVQGNNGTSIYIFKIQIIRIGLDGVQYCDCQGDYWDEKDIILVPN